MQTTQRQVVAQELAHVHPVHADDIGVVPPRVPRACATNAVNLLVRRIGPQYVPHVALYVATDRAPPVVHAVADDARDAVPPAERHPPDPADDEHHQVVLPLARTGQKAPHAPSAWTSAGAIARLDHIRRKMNHWSGYARTIRSSDCMIRRVRSAMSRSSSPLGRQSRRPISIIGCIPRSSSGPRTTTAGITQAPVRNAI